MTVRDNGTAKSAAESERGLGLRIMDYRAGSVGGSLEVKPSQAEGFVVTCRLPLEGVSGRDPE